ncbi:DegT/DnrJ/EryC1/StrS family aminotransferase [Streptomyces sp. NBC_01275]|uniref:DegT/DnrJ/EryC1/StrS family aminotransferase n=1 Tax=Streptomyces sp. NBC_01275 TaxID=2903807 RepID=UPI0022507D98|nr:DegT/DnrJ/EryC1/StrS family aminotransferase [Streptomyces sp. NBC_01275]MCX4763821.1 DegT/DnrJ/EryC1/StrS family aminotransferase [Streptomyces sp. NBC_01275]
MANGVEDPSSALPVSDTPTDTVIRIPLSRPNLTALERSYVDSALDDGWISGTGRFVTRFEEGISKRVGRTYTTAVANGTLALELALRALGIGPGDEVIVPAFTFAAPATTVLAVGAVPVLVDVDPETWTIDAHAARAARTARTRAVIAVDVLGHPADYDALRDLGAPVIQDAAEAHGAAYRGRPVGGQGDLSVFSFHANKAITTGEGGSVSTDSAELAARMTLLTNHGMTPQRPYVHEVVGRNFRMTNLTAALGLGQLDRWDELTGARNSVAHRYTERLDPEAYVPRPVAPWAGYSCWLHTVTVPADRRGAVLAHLRSRGIDARAVWPPLHEQPVLARPGVDCPVAEDVARRAFWLPSYAGMSDTDIDLVAAALAEAPVRK